MIIRRRLRSILIPLALYAMAGPTSAYFVWHAVNGERGLKARAEYEVEMGRLLIEAKRLRTEQRSLERRIALLRSPAVDRDILDEQARDLLGRVNADEVVIFLPPAAKP